MVSPPVCRWSASLAVLLLVLSGCEPTKAPPVAPPVSPPSAPSTTADGVSTWFPEHVGSQTLRMQVAVRPDEMEHGLMMRKDLAPDDGMIFVYEKPQGMSFWMKDTPTPLDIGFFDAQGVLREIFRMYAYDTTGIQSKRQDLQYALEMNLGWYKQHNIEPGAQLDLPALRAALKDRGFNPALYTPPETSTTP